MRRKFISISIVFTLIMNFFIPLNTDAVYASGVTLSVEKVVDKSEVFVGEEFTYTLKYANPNTTNHANNVVLTDTLPDGLEIVPVDPSNKFVLSNHIESAHDDGKTVTFVFKDPLPAGSTGVVKIKAKFKEGITADQTVVKNKATIKSGTSPDEISVVSNEVEVKAKTKSSDWSIEKKLYVPASATPALDQLITYEIIVKGNSKEGGLNLTDVSVVDTLPSGCDYIDPAHGGIADDGVYNSGNNTMTWNIGNLNVGQTVKRYVTVRYPSSTFSVGTTVTNIVDANAKEYITATPLNLHAELSHGFAVATYLAGNFYKSSRQNNDEYSIGQYAKFYLNNISNDGNVPLDNMTIIDTIPVQIDLKSVSTGKYNHNNTVDVYYETNKASDVWVVWAEDQSMSNNTVLNVPTLASDEYITRVKWELGRVNPGFKNTSSINITGEILSKAKDNTDVTVGSGITNTATLTAANITDKTSSVTIQVVDPRPWVSPSKNINGSKSYYEEERVNYVLTLKNHDFATGDLNNPYAIDVIPMELEDISLDGWDGSHASASEAPTTFTYTKNIDGQTRTIYKWKFENTTLKPGEYITVRYSGKVKVDTRVGFVDNIMYMTTLPNDYKASGKIDDSNDLDDNPATGYLVKANERFFVNFTGSLESEKLVKGELDSSWGKYPGSGKTLPGGIADYELTVKNTGSNGPIGNIVVIDVLPYIGDNGLIDTKPRQSKWVPYLVNQIKVKEVPASVSGGTSTDQIKIYYSTQKNPDLAQLHNPLVKNNNGWSETPPDDITTVKSLKFDFGNIELDINEKIVLEWPMRAPVGAITGEVTWNSFAFGATYPDVKDDVQIAEPFLPSEPIKVGYEIQADPSGIINLGDYVWEDMNKNGIQDDGEPAVNGVLVKLLDELGTQLKYTRTGIDHTNKDGYYLFPNLLPGKYILEFELPAGYEFTPKGLGGDSTKDSDVNVGTSRTDAITLVADVDNLDIDAGIFRDATLGDYVWNDRDADGIQDGGEPGLNGITVQLFNADNPLNSDGDNSNDIVLLTTTTKANAGDPDGYYQFSNLDPGNYFIKVINNGDYKFSPSFKGSNADKDSNVSDAGKSNTIFLESGESDQSMDAGMYLATLGDKIWHDLDADGIQDSGESGIKNVTVELYKDDVKINQMSTNNSGIYTFIDLVPGNYKIKVIKPADYDKYSAKDVDVDGSGSNDATDDIKDSDCNTDTGLSDNVTLNAGDRVNTLDQGLYKLATLGDLVWNDLDHDGYQDGYEDGYQIGDEPGIENVVVELKDKNGDSLTPEIKDTTDNKGNYLFENLEPGEYRVYINLNQATLSNYVVTAKDKGDNNFDSDIDSTGVTTSITLQSGEDIRNVDAGFHKALLGDFVWEDMNADGTQNDGDTGVDGVQVKLYKSDGDRSDDVAIATTTTAINETGKSGYYVFTDLVNGDYYVEFIPPANYKLIEPDLGDDSKDSDYRIDSNQTDDIALSKGESNLTVDAGYYRPASLGNFVWDDKDGDGTQDSGEPGVNGINVHLYSNADVLVKSTSTASQSGNPGYYIFNDLKPGDYYIKFEKGSYDLFTVDNINSDDADSDANDDDASPSFGKTISTTLISNEEDLSWDSGLVKYGSIGNFVWEDINIDGIQDAGEPGIENAQVKLYKHDGSDYKEVGSTSTDNTGAYTFTHLRPGDYKVKFHAINQYYNTPLKDAGGDDAKDSDVDGTGVDLFTASYFLTSGENNDTVDAGYYQSSSIGNFIWHDKDADGIQDSGEEGIGSISINLYDDKDNLIATNATDSTGKYLFENKPIGKYKIKVDKSDTDGLGYVLSNKDVGSNDELDSDIASVNYESEIIDLGPNEDNLSLDAGFYKLASLGDYVWEDMNGDGTQDPSEPVIENVKVTLTKPDSTTEEQRTGADGKYQFVNLIPGNYKVTFETPSGFVLTKKDNTVDDEKDSDPDSTSLSSTIDIFSGENITSMDAGYYRLGKIGDLVWIDANRNGIQDVGEKGAKDVQVTLTLPDNSTMETTTNANGNYLFDNLAPGSYEVEFKAPSGYGFVKKHAGDVNKDSDANTSTGLTGLKVLLSGGEELSIDAGIYLIPIVDIRVGKIGDYVWLDANNNGIQDSFEKGLEGVKVVLSTWYGNEEITYTDSNGKYLFDELANGVYSIRFEKPSGYTFATRGAGGTTVDSDVDSEGRVSSVYMPNGDTILTIDAGLVGKAQLGNYAWIDNNRNHVQDSEDAPYAGMIIKLYDSNNNYINETITDANGRYLFTNLVPGDYYIMVEKPQEYEFVNKDVGGDTLDSDMNSEGRSDIIHLSINESNLTLDIGLMLPEEEEPEEKPDEKPEDETPPEDEGNNDGGEEPGDGGNEEEPGDTNIIIIDDDKEPVKDATIVIKNKDGEVIKNGTTDENGNFDVSDLPKGEELTVSIIKDGFEDEDFIIEIEDEEIPLSIGTIKPEPDSVLPVTGTSYYHFLLIGVLLLLTGTWILKIDKKRRVKVVSK